MVQKGLVSMAVLRCNGGIELCIFTEFRLINGAIYSLDIPCCTAVPYFILVPK